MTERQPKLTQKAQRLVDNLIKSAGESYYLDDQGFDNQIKIAKQNLACDKEALEEFILNLQGKKVKKIYGPGAK